MINIYLFLHHLMSLEEQVMELRNKCAQLQREIDELNRENDILSINLSNRASENAILQDMVNSLQEQLMSYMGLNSENGN